LARRYHAFVHHRLPASDFAGSAAYWEQRYEAGSDSGRGSYGKSARFKAKTLNEFVTRYEIASVIEFGCGDGNQLALAEYPTYIGYDVSDNAVARCRARFSHDPTKVFHSLADYGGERADLAISLDVIYHLVEDDVFAAHIRTLFGAAERFVIIYSTNAEIGQPSERTHVRHRHFTDFVAECAAGWQLRQEIGNSHRHTRNTGGSPWSADFFVFGRSDHVSVREGRGAKAV
jgi:SAM-dependent methyltransferase